MKTILEILNLSTEYLQQRNIKNSRRQAEELLGEALGIGRLGLYLEFDRPLNDEELARCRLWLQRRAKGEPLQYISGYVNFFNCRIKVNPDVLIPRQETEILVDKISKELACETLENKILWDICCGSGCIGIALKKRFPQLTVCLSDISQAALATTEENAQSNDVQVELVKGDFCKPFKEKEKRADFIVCNPPYISENEHQTLEIEVREYEPKLALVSGKTGLEFYKRLADDLPALLKPHGKAWFEIGDGQGAALHEIFQAPCWKKREVENDWAGHQRFFSLEIE